MREIYEYIWIFPLIGGIFSILALLTPAAYFSESFYTFNLWMWGLISVQVNDPYFGSYGETTFIDNIFILTPSVIASIIIGVSSIILISSAVTCKKKLKADDIIKSNWLTPAILILISTIAWIISIELVFLLGPTSMSFWETNNPGFGVIGMFLGSGFAIGGYIISKYGAKQRDEVIFVANRNEISISTLASAKSGMSIKYCPECGTKAEEELQHFCRNCGFKLI
ncbi:MAG: zinc ribbon domain-containing protein [Candidatus Lokiarchaeota archaeon]|nr:zinc ribbon domain-containing protein [Candidatus Lokiarchaeota archaeon]